MPDVDLPATLKSLKAIAAAQMKQYPQYKGHFKTYRLARVKCDVRTKAGQAFVKGEFAIGVKAASPLHFGGPRFVTLWSRRNQIDTSVAEIDVEWL